MWTAAAAAEPTPAERETARGLMQTGDELRASGDLPAALARYQSAHALMHVPTTGLEVARVQAELGLLVEARSAAAEVINLPLAAAAEPLVFTQAREAAARLSSELEPRVPSLTTEVTPAGVAYTLTIDNVTLPADARGVAYRTNPGAHTVVVQAEGYVAQSQQVTLAERQVQTLRVQLVARYGMNPSSPPSAAAQGRYPRAPAAAMTSTSDSDPAGPGRLRGILGLSIGGAVLIAGGVCGVLSVVQTKTEKDKCEAGRCDRDGLSGANTLANVSNVTIPLGALGIGYGIFELATLPSSQDARARASVRFQLTGLGAAMRADL